MYEAIVSTHWTMQHRTMIPETHNSSLLPGGSFQSAAHRKGTQTEPSNLAELRKQTGEAEATKIL